MQMNMNLNNMYSQYGAMPSPYGNVNMLPPTSATGLDLNSALSKSFYPSLSSTLYGNELFKKLQQAYSDPISSLYAPPSSSLPATSASLTSLTSNSLSSLLRSPLAPPPLATHSLATIANNYNANSIPLSSTSIFANKPPSTSSSPSSSSSLSALTGGSLQSTSNVTKSPVAQYPVKQPSLLNKNQKIAKRLGQHPNIIAANRKNNSSNLAILPDNGITPLSNRNGHLQQPIVPKRLPSFANVQAIATTPTATSSTSLLSSARTNSPYIQRKPPNPPIQLQPRKSYSAISSPGTLTKQVTGLVKPVNRAAVAAISKQSPLARNMAEKISNLVKNSNLAIGGKQVLNLPKTTTITKSSSKAGTAVGTTNKKPNSVDAIPQIQKQLEKNQTSMTDAASSKSTPLQIASVIGGPENSVSIIKLPQLNAASASSTIVHRPPPNTTNSSMAITPRPTPNIVRKGVNAGQKFTVINRQPSASTTTNSNNKIVISPQHLNPQFRQQQQQQQNHKRPANVRNSCFILFQFYLILFLYSRNSLLKVQKS